MSEEYPALEGEAPMAAADGEAEVPVAGEEAAAAQPAAEAPVVEMRKKKPCALYWKRPKSHLYEYNYGYGENYYKVCYKFFFFFLVVESLKWNCD